MTTKTRIELLVDAIELLADELASLAEYSEYPVEATSRRVRSLIADIRTPDNPGGEKHHGKD